MITASSPSKCTSFDDGGSRIASPSPITEVDGFRKIIGVLGASLPISLAWSA